MTKDHFQDWMQHTFSKEILATSKAGQAEYAQGKLDAFDNFRRQAANLDLTPEQCLLVYANKHHDGIMSWVKGHKSQREPVQGRIKDLIVYLFLLWAMIEETENGVKGGPTLPQSEV